MLPLKLVIPVPLAEDIFWLDEGPVHLSYPKYMTPVNVADFEARIQLVLRQLKRRATADTVAENGSHI